MEEKYFTLNNGVKMPCTGLGVFRNTDPAECERSVICAIENGCRMIDTAAVYRNEEAVGRAIKHCGVPREELFITTKLWYADCSEKRVERALERSLKKLGLDYVDLYLVHEPYGHVKSAWRGMEKCADDGRIRAIGVSNFGQKQLASLMKQAHIQPAVDQIELHPYYIRQELLDFLKKNGILAEAWAPFGAGKAGIFADPAIAYVAKKHGCTPAQAILAWLHSKGAATIPKSSNPARIKENLNFAAFVPDAEDTALIEALDRGRSLFPWDKGINVPLRKVMGFFHIGI